MAILPLSYTTTAGRRLRSSPRPGSPALVASGLRSEYRILFAWPQRGLVVIRLQRRTSNIAPDRSPEDSSRFVRKEEGMRLGGFGIRREDRVV